MGIEIRRILGVAAFCWKSGTLFALDAALSILAAKLFFDFERFCTPPERRLDTTLEASRKARLRHENYADSRHRQHLRFISCGGLCAVTNKKLKKNAKREERIAMEIVVDAYGADEQAMGWYCYLEDQLTFPFRARCAAERAISPLEIGVEVEAIGMAPAEECGREMFVSVRYGKRALAVPLSQLQIIDGEAPSSTQAMDDWHYWVEMGYEFG